ncbi:INNER NO OUTER [Prunus yedoensis var. nudiflora]|uniref:INNER NO OUTER n=1 Tax=Prunus yedoensis var. nudiflora TaxID=2094558 RepID=A0A314UU24_PRUYE|nr:INNER NO OUTER [Prunus yedoensis var. nudiflora]
MMKASFVPLHLIASLTQDEQREELCLEEVDKQNNRPLDMRSPSMVVSNSDNEEEDTISMNPIVNKPPEKRQRAPSAYNHFINGPSSLQFSTKEMVQMERAALARERKYDMGF